MGGWGGARYRLEMMGAACDLCSLSILLFLKLISEVDYDLSVFGVNVIR
jgi:hypothetical protein